MARANPRGAVSGTPAGSKLLTKLRADEQEHHMRRRAEASWHKTTKPRDLTAAVNDAVVLLNFMFLSGSVRRMGICSTSDRSITSQAAGRSSLGVAVAIGGCKRTRWTPIALMGIAPPVIEQKLVDGIVAKRPS